MEIAKKEHNRSKKKETTTSKKKVIPSWFNESISSSEVENEDEEFKSFIEEFRK